MSRRPRRRHAVAAMAPAPVVATTADPIGRIEGIDALRGTALLLMIVYHFTFDLRLYGVIAADFEHDPFWLGFRGVIVASFLTLVGISLVLAAKAGVPRTRFWRRIAVIAACALAASVGSWLLFPRTYIYFGILHAIVLTSIVAWPMVDRPRFALGLGLATIAAGLTLSHPAFDARALSWIGFVTHKPATEDYVPLAPWAGFALVGIALGHAMAKRRFRDVAPLSQTPFALRWLGRHSLAVYMLHQPILLGVLWLALR